MLNSSSSLLPETFRSAVTFAQPQSNVTAKAAPDTLVSLLAKSLGASRPDWRKHRHARTAYASSRVIYTEEKMTEEQAREFE
jgi:hypothetical protein